MADYGVKITKEGKSVGTAGLQDLLFHSKYPLLKIKVTGSGSITVVDSSSFGSVDVYAHNLGYQPLYFMYSQIYDPFADTTYTDYSQVPKWNNSAGGVIYYSYTTTMGTDKLTYTAETQGGDSGTHVLNYYYAIYYDPDE